MSVTKLSDLPTLRATLIDIGGHAWFREDSGVSFSSNPTDIIAAIVDAVVDELLAKGWTPK